MLDESENSSQSGQDDGDFSRQAVENGANAVKNEVEAAENEVEAVESAPTTEAATTV